MSERPPEQRDPTRPAQPGHPVPPDDTVVLADGPPDAPPGAPPARGRRFPPDFDRDLGLALAGVLLVLALVAAGIWWATQEDEQTVPDVVGLQLEEAQERLAEEDLDHRVERVDADAPQDEVVRQSPAAGESVDPDVVVELTVSDGPQTIVLPRVVGSTVEEATETLSEAGIRFETRGVASQQPRGTVVRQNPPAGEEVDRREVVVVLAVAERDAPEMVQVPGLVGMASAEARQALEELDLRPTQRAEASTQAQGTVIRQSPGAGTRVEQGSTVTLVVSTGPATLDVPDVVNLSEREARRSLEEAGFEVRVENRPGDPYEAGTVRSQRPAAGASRPRGSVVTIVVARQS